MMNMFLKNLNLTEMIYMNWLEIYHVMMKELYDISVMFFKIFKRFRKVVLIFKFKKKWGKMRVKWGKKADLESPNIHYLPDTF